MVWWVCRRVWAGELVGGRRGMTICARKTFMKTSENGRSPNGNESIHDVASEKTHSPRMCGIRNMSLEHTKQVPGCVHHGIRCGTIQRPRLRAKCFPLSLQQTMLHHHQPFLVASSEDSQDPHNCEAVRVTEKTKNTTACSNLLFLKKV